VLYQSGRVKLLARFPNDDWNLIISNKMDSTLDCAVIVHVGTDPNLSGFAVIFVLSGMVSARGKQLCRVAMINLFQSLTAKPESI
jgi:hypothetical protein